MSNENVTLPLNQTQEIKHSDTVVTPELKQDVIQVETPKEDFAAKFAAMARQEKKMRIEAKQLKAEREAMKAELESGKSWKTRLTQDPLTVMQEAGLSYDQITQLMLNQPKPEDLKIKTLEKKLEDLELNHKDNQKKQYEQAKKQLRSEVKMLAAKDEAFETVRSYGDYAYNAVVELIEETFNSDGVMMSVEDAAKEVEEYLFDQALGLAKLKKVQAKLTPQQEALLKQEETKQPQLNTLSNRTTPSTNKPLTAKERRDRAVLMLQGKL